MSTLFNLAPGQHLTVREGVGLEPVAAEMPDEYVAFATKHYIITATGIFLTSADWSGFIRSRKIEPAGYYISAKARLLHKAHQLNLEVPYQSIAATDGDDGDFLK